MTINVRVITLLSFTNLASIYLVLEIDAPSVELISNLYRDLMLGYRSRLRTMVLIIQGMVGNTSRRVDPYDQESEAVASINPNEWAKMKPESSTDPYTL